MAFLEGHGAPTEFTPGGRRRATVLAGLRSPFPRFRPLEPTASRGDGRHLLLVEPDPGVALRLCDALRAHGYWVSVALTASTAQNLARALAFDGLVANETMAGFWRAGLSLEPVVPSAVPMVVTRPGRPGRWPGLRPAVPAAPGGVLSALKNALGDHAPWPEGAETLIMGSARFEIDRRRLTVEGEVMDLTPNESRLLWTLAMHAHAPVRRETLKPEQTGRGIDIAIMRLRRQFEPDPRDPAYLRTVRGVGYMLIPDAIIRSSSGVPGRVNTSQHHG